MKFIKLSIAGIRKIKLATIELPEKGVKKIKGKNRQGKSTILDSFRMLLQGRTISKDVVQHGKDSGLIEGEISGPDGIVYTVSRKIEDGSSKSLKVSRSDGLNVGSPQTFLDSLINELTFDPRPFISKKVKEKLDFMVNLLNIDITKEQEEIDSLKTKRLYYTQRIKDHGKPESVPKAEKVNTQSLMIDLNRIRQINENAQKDAVEVEQANQDIERRKAKYQDAIVGFNEQIKQLEEQIVTLKQRVKDGEKAIKELPKPAKVPVVKLQSTEEIEQKIANADATNEKALKYEQFVMEMAQWQQLTEEREAANNRIIELRNQIRHKLTEAKMPIPGLSIVIDDEEKPDGLYYNDVHSEEWSYSEALRISASIAAAMQPQLRAIFLDNGEAMDEDTLSEFVKWAEENDIQALVTIVSAIPDDKEDDVIYIEEGEIVV